MKIASIQLSKNEDHSIYPKKYGAGSIFSKWARVLKNNNDNLFLDCAAKECFDNLTTAENTDRIYVISEETSNLIKNGHPIKDLIPNAENFDIFIHNHDELKLNTEGVRGKEVIWLAFVNQTTFSPNVLIYSYDQNPRVLSDAKVFKMQIGSYIPDNFEDIINENYLFQCTRLDITMNPIPFVKICNKYKIKGLFAGPIFDNYPILDYIDNKNTFYLGIISEQEKLSLCKKARLFNCCQDWDTIFNLSAVSALGQGCPLISYDRGCFKYLIQDGVNGFYYDQNEDNFLKIWEKSNNINRKAIWENSKKWSHTQMIDSFYAAFEQIIK